MLNRDLDGAPVFGPDDLTVEYDAEGCACGVKVQDVVAKTKVVIADPSYFPKLCQPTGKVVRCIALLSKPIEGSADCDSFQVAPSPAPRPIAPDLTSPQAPSATRSRLSNLQHSLTPTSTRRLTQPRPQPWP
jgi:hypothetical protein